MKKFSKCLKVLSTICLVLALLVTLFFGSISTAHIITSVKNGTYGVQGHYCDMSPLIMIFWGLILLIPNGALAITSIVGLIISYANKILRENKNHRIYFAIMLVASIAMTIIFGVISTLYIEA